MLIIPLFRNLFLLPGGGTLCLDLASGDRVRIPFPVGELEFIADYDPGGDVPAYQYCPLFAPVSQFATHVAAQAAAEEALAALFTVVEPAVREVTAEPELPAVAEAPIPARRAFFRKVAGHLS